MNNNYYNSINNNKEKDVYTPSNKSVIRSNEICDFINTEYYQVKRTKAKVNVYIRKSN